MLVLSSLGILYYAYVLFSIHNELAGLEVNGEPFLPEFNVNYVRIENTLFNSIGAMALVSFLAWITALFKRQPTQLLYIILAVWTALYIHVTSHQSGIVISDIEKIKFDICNLTSNGPELDIQFKFLVNRWMCTEQCRCYEGENGENKELWMSYGEEVLLEFNRNTGDIE